MIYTTDCGFGIAEYVDYQWIPQSAIRNPKSAIRCVYLMDESLKDVTFQ
jgi:hypothetical protein